MHDEMTPAERDLRTAALNSNSTIKILNAIRDRLEDLPGARQPTGGFRSPGEFMNSIRRLATEHVKDTRLVNAVTTFGGEGTGADGGFAAAPAWNADAILPVTGSGSLLSAFSPMVTESNLVILGVDETPEWGTDGIAAEVMAEGAAITPTKGVLKQVRIPLHRVPALEHASEEIEDDSGGFSRYVWNALSRKLANRVEALVVRGSGVDEPLGFLNAPGLVTQAKEGSQTRATSPLLADNCGKMISRLIPGGYPRAFWVAHTSLLPTIAGLGVNYYDAGGSGPFGAILGRPLYVSEHMSTAGTVGDLALVDPAGYVFALRGRDDVAVIGFAFDQFMSSYRSTIRFGGAPLLSAPVARRTGSDTFSHVVVLGV